MPAKLLKMIDEAAMANYESRSDYIRMSVVLRMKKQSIIELIDMFPEDPDVAAFLKSLQANY